MWVMPPLFLLCKSVHLIYKIDEAHDRSRRVMIIIKGHFIYTFEMSSAYIYNIMFSVTSTL